MKGCGGAPSPLDVLHDAHAAGVTAPRDHAHVADLELDGVDRLARLEVHLDGVVHLGSFIDEKAAIASYTYCGLVLASSPSTVSFTRCG